MKTESNEKSLASRGMIQGDETTDIVCSTLSLAFKSIQDLKIHNFQEGHTLLQMSHSYL